MRGLKRNPRLAGLAVLLAGLVVAGGTARADVYTDQSGSILIFPKVVADGTRDTLIQIANTGNMSAQAHCYYVNMSGFCANDPSRTCALDSDCPTGDTCTRRCQVQDFDIFLTGQQPTMWRVSTGRLSDPTVPACKVGQSCSCATSGSAAAGQRCPGFSPGTTASAGATAIKPVEAGFVGELKCVQVNRDFEQPYGGNKLKGEAVIENLATNDLTEYNAFAVAALGGLNTNAFLNLDETEYDVCPKQLILNHYAEGAADDFTGATIGTDLTLVPCTEFLEADPGPGTRSRAAFRITNEYEQPLTGSVTFDCGLTKRLSGISSQFLATNIGSQFAKTRFEAPDSTICMTGSKKGQACTVDGDCPGALSIGGTVVGGCRAWPGLLGLAEEFHGSGGSATVQLFQEGKRRTNQADLIWLGL